MTIRYVLTALGALGLGVAATTAWQELAAPRDGVASAAVRAPRVEASREAALRGMLRQELARVRADITDLKVTQAAASTEPVIERAADEPAVDLALEERRLAAYDATSALLTARLAAKRWRREDELEWRRLSIDLAPDQYAELRNKLNSAINSGDVDSSDLDRMR